MVVSEGLGRRVHSGALLTQLIWLETSVKLSMSDDDKINVVRKKVWFMTSLEEFRDLRLGSS